MNGELKQKLTRPSIWLRLIYMIVLAIAFNIAEIVIFAVAVFQFLVVLFTRSTNDQLTGFGRNLSHYVQQVVAYLTFATEDKPFPFSSWPDVAHAGDQEPFAGAHSQELEADIKTEPAPKKRKPAPKKGASTRTRKTPPKSND